MNPTAPAPAAFCMRRLAVALPAAAVVGLVLARAAAEVEPHFAPWLLFPVLVGLVLGATLVALVRIIEIGNRFTAVLMAVVAAFAAVGGQHYLAYREACQVARQQAAEVQKAQKLASLFAAGRAPEPPDSLWEFLRWEAARGRTIGALVARDAWVWLSWGLDAALLLGAALGLVLPALRQPYCDHCRSWYRTTRGGSLSGETSQELLAVLGLPVPEDLRSAQYRLVACRGGCGATGFEMRPDAASRPCRPIRVWLDVDRRNQVLQVLDLRSDGNRLPK